jgi:hypothetical protein
MSSKGFNIMQRLRTKSFSSEKGYYAPQPPLGYHYIENFDNVTEEDCVKFDNQNKEIYKKNMELYEHITKKIENRNALFKIDSPPTPPDVPNNYEKYVKHKLRNSLKNVKLQSYAVLYLLNKNYKLIFNNFDNKLENEFEPFEAISLVEKLENNSIDNIIKIVDHQDISNSPSSNRKSIYSTYAPSYDYQQYYPGTPTAPTVQTVPSAQYNSYPSLYPPPPNNTSYYPQYQLSSSAPPLIDSNQKESEQKKHLVSGPPALHYMPK